MDHVLRHLEADEAATDHHRPLRRQDRLEARVGVHPGGLSRMPFNPLADHPDVRHGAHPKDAQQIDPGQGRADRRRARGQDQLVVGLGRHFAGYDVAQIHGFLRRRDRGRLAAGAHIDRELLAEHPLVRHQQARLARDHAPDMVGQPAVRIRDVRPALHHQDLRSFVQPAQPRRTRRAAGDAANDDNLHFM